MENQEFDLSMYEASEFATLNVMDQKEEQLTYNGKPVTIDLYGPGSEQYIKAQSKNEKENQARTFAALRGKPLKEGDDEGRKQQARKLVSCTKSINNFPIPGGAEELYSNPRLGYIRDQVAKFIEDWENFPSRSIKT